MFSELPIMVKARVIGWILMIIFAFGCSSVPLKKAEKGGAIIDQEAEPVETQKDITTALGTMGGALTGKELSEKELSQIAKQIRKDKEAESAVKAITESVSGKQIQVKYCPICGQRFDPSVEICPVHNVNLEFLEK